MDLSSLGAGASSQLEAASFLHLRNPIDDEPLYDVVHAEATEDDPSPDPEKIPVGIDLYSWDSARVQQVIHSQQARRLAKKGVVKKNGSINLAPEELERDGIEVLIAATANVHCLSIDNKPVRVDSDAMLRKLYSTRWIREQVEEHMQDRGNYLGN